MATTVTPASHSARVMFDACSRKFMFARELRLELPSSSAGRRMGKAFALALEHADQDKVDESYGIEWDVVLDDANRDFHVPRIAGFEGDVPQETIDAVLLEAGKARVMAAAYLERYAGDVTLGELEREVRFVSPVVGEGVLDGILTQYGFGMDQVRRVESRVGIEDKLLNRNFWRRSDEERLHIDNQVTAYFYAMREAGTPLDRMLYRVTLKPSIDRRMSRNPETIDEYLDRLSGDIRERPEFYFNEYELYRSDEQLDEFAEEVREIDLEINRSRRRKAWRRSTERCSDYGGCEFLALCRGVPGAIEAFVQKPNVVNEEQRGVLLDLSSLAEQATGADGRVEGTRAEEIAKATGADGRVVSRIMGQLVKLELVERVGPGRYATTSQGRARIVRDRERGLVPA